MFHLSYRMSLMLQNFIFIAVSTHSHIPCHCEAHYKWALFNSSSRIYFFLYKNLISWFKLYNLPEYTLTQAALYIFTCTRSRWTIYCHRCLYTQSRKYKQLRRYNRDLFYSILIKVKIWNLHEQKWCTIYTKLISRREQN